MSQKLHPLPLSRWPLKIPRGYILENVFLMAALRRAHKVGFFALSLSPFGEKIRSAL
nr:MAG TPA: hypothetical protein [Caudoviricetes sp.]